MSHGGDDRSGLPSGLWMSPGEHIADGGQGSVHFWVKVDDAHRVIDRIVIKDSWSDRSTEEPVEYDGIYQELVRKGMDFGASSSGAVGTAPATERFFKEAYIQGLLTPDNGDISYNMPLRGYKRGHKTDPFGKHDTTHWRMYMDHLHSGDMDTLIAKYVVTDIFGDNVPTPIPEPFIWYTLQSLTSALIEMEETTRARPKARDARDETIVMFDMKPNNIFLAPPGGSKYPVYPRPIIGDFGGAQLTFTEDVENIWGLMEEVCTRGFYAPEMRRTRHINEDDMEDHQFESLRVENLPVYSWTNIWQLGRSIECMMRGLRSMPDIDWANETVDRRESQIKKSPPQFTYSPGFQYSEDLKRIVYNCQLFTPEHRPTPRELMEIINENISYHVNSMDFWGTEAWIREQEYYAVERTREQNELVRQKNYERVAAGKLYFLDDYKLKGLAEMYTDLNMDVPDECALVWGGKEAKYKLGQVVGVDDTPQKPDKKRKRPDSPDDDGDSEAFLDSSLRKKPKP